MARAIGMAKLSCMLSTATDLLVQILEIVAFPLFLCMRGSQSFSRKAYNAFVLDYRRALWRVDTHPPHLRVHVCFVIVFEI